MNLGAYDPIAQMELERKRLVVEHDKLKGEVRKKLQDAALGRVPQAYRDARVLPLVFFSDERLKAPCLQADPGASAIRELVSNMALTMYLCGGVGLAAPQVGVSLRVFVCDWGQQRGQLKAFINPSIVASSAFMARMPEACLSIPGARLHIERPAHVTIRHQDFDGRWTDTALTEWPARIVQHEMDHLDGKLMIDMVSPLERRLAVRGLAKMRKRETAPKKKPGRKRR